MARWLRYTSTDLPKLPQLKRVEEMDEVKHNELALLRIETLLNIRIAEQASRQAQAAWAHADSLSQTYKDKLEELAYPALLFDPEGKED